MSRRAGYFIIPKTVIDVDDNGIDDDDDMTNILEKATKYAIEQKWPISHGDLGRLECYCGANTDGTYCGYYRNEGLLVWNQDRFEDLTYISSDYGDIPQDFLLYEEPDYFEEHYWAGDDTNNAQGIKSKTTNMDRGINYRDTRWLRVNDEMVHNITYYRNEDDDDEIVYTYWTDCRGKERYLIYEEESFGAIDNSEKAIVGRFIKKLKGIIQVDSKYFDDENLPSQIMGLADDASVVYIRNFIGSDVN
jgi:hypothetical protein